MIKFRFNPLTSVLGLTFVVGGLSLPSVALPPANLLAQSSQPLRGQWTLIGWGDRDNLTSPLSETEVTVSFEGENLGGVSGCNSYTGSYETSGRELTVGPLASTLRICEDPVNDQETQYLSALGSAESYEINNRGELLITYSDPSNPDAVLVFSPAAIPALW